MIRLASQPIWSVTYLNRFSAGSRLIVTSLDCHRVLKTQQHCFWTWVFTEQTISSYSGPDLNNISLWIFNCFTSNDPRKRESSAMQTLSQSSKQIQITQHRFEQLWTHYRPRESGMNHSWTSVASQRITHLNPAAKTLSRTDFHWRRWFIHMSLVVFSTNSKARSFIKRMSW